MIISPFIYWFYAHALLDKFSLIGASPHYWSLSCWSSCIGYISIQTISINICEIFLKKNLRKRHIFCLSFTLGGFTCPHLHHLPDQHDRQSDRPG